MPSIIRNDATVAALRSYLKRDGYELDPEPEEGKPGADIVAHKDGQTIIFEVIGYKSNQPLRTKDFNHAFFQAIAWIGRGASRAVIAVPSRFAAGLPIRAKNLGDAWVRLGTEFKELEIWLVDNEKRSYAVTTWNQWAQPREELVSA